MIKQAHVKEMEVILANADALLKCAQCGTSNAATDFVDCPECGGDVCEGCLQDHLLVGCWNA